MGLTANFPGINSDPAFANLVLAAVHGYNTEAFIERGTTTKATTPHADGDVASEHALDEQGQAVGYNSYFDGKDGNWRYSCKTEDYYPRCNQDRIVTYCCRKKGNKLRLVKKKGYCVVSCTSGDSEDGKEVVHVGSIYR